MLKDILDDLCAQLEQEASANFRSLDQEALARLQRSLDLEPAMNTERDQHWVEEALASGPETPLARAEMDAVRDRILAGKLRPEAVDQTPPLPLFDQAAQGP